MALAGSCRNSSQVPLDGGQQRRTGDIVGVVRRIVDILDPQQLAFMPLRGIRNGMNAEDIHIGAEEDPPLSDGEIFQAGVPSAVPELHLRCFPEGASGDGGIFQDHFLNMDHSPYPVIFCIVGFHCGDGSHHQHVRVALIGFMVKGRCQHRGQLRAIGTADGMEIDLLHTVHLLEGFHILCGKAIDPGRVGVQTHRNAGVVPVQDACQAS